MCYDKEKRRIIYKFKPYEQTARTDLGGEERVIKAGDTYYTKKDEPHGVVCRKAGRLLDVFTPRREDFLK